MINISIDQVNSHKNNWLVLWIGGILYDNVRVCRLGTFIFLCNKCFRPTFIYVRCLRFEWSYLGLLGLLWEFLGQ